jgi:hypothetical protein
MFCVLVNIQNRPVISCYVPTENLKGQRTDVNVFVSFMVQHACRCSLRTFVRLMYLTAYQLD